MVHSLAARVTIWGTAVISLLNFNSLQRGFDDAKAETIHWVDSENA